MGFRDLLLFYVATGFSLRWIATASAAGPSAVVIWLSACVCFYLPLVLTVLELSSRYPSEGGVYVWAKESFGGFAGFLTAWTYWTSNLPYFPSLLYFTAANALFLAGGHGAALANEPVYFVVASCAGLALAVGLNVRGLDIAKWLHNAGAVTLWLPAVILVALASVALLRFGSATPFTFGSLVPSTHLKDIIFWSTIAFSLSGAESASMLGDEIEQPRRNVPRALLTAGALITSVYILATVAIMVALPAHRVPEIQGVMLAIESLAGHFGLSIIALFAAALVVVSGIGQTGAWFAAAARLPFVAGIDRYLPPAFARVHPRWHTPYVALLVQAAFSVVFIFLSQAGTGVKGANDVLVSMSIIGYFIPYLFMFAALIKVQSVPAGPGVMRIPGGPRVARVVASVGLVVTAGAIFLSLLPAADEPNKPLAVVKIVGLSALLVGVGTALYWNSVRRRR
jgi:amino acid transporter